MPETGVLFFTDTLDRDELGEYATRLEALGIDTLWLPELFGREPFATAGYLLARSERLRVGTGIANIYARDAVASAAGRRTLAELSAGRFSLGLGVSNAGLNRERGHTWSPPLGKLNAYLDALEKAPLVSLASERPAPLYLAAHGPRLLRLAAERCDGALTYLMTPAHTTRARAVLGTGKALHVTQMALLCPEPGRARKLARRAIQIYVGLGYYQRAWRDQGFDDGDFRDGGSDELVDALVAWGDADAIRARLNAQREAGASQIIVVPLNPERGAAGPHWPLLEALQS